MKENEHQHSLKLESMKLFTHPPFTDTCIDMFSLPECLKSARAHILFCFLNYSKWLHQCCAYNVQMGCTANTVDGQYLQKRPYNFFSLEASSPYFMPPLLWAHNMAQEASEIVQSRNFTERTSKQQ